MSDLHRLDSETCEPRIVPTDRRSQHQSGQASGPQTKHLIDNSLRAQLRALPTWVVVSLCVFLAFVFMGVIGGSLAAKNRGSAP